MHWGLRAPLIAAAISAAVLMIWPLAAAAQPAEWSELAPRAQAWLRDAYAKAPALVMGLGALLAIPPLALLGYILRWTQKRHVRAVATPVAWDDDIMSTIEAFVEVGGERRPIDRQLLQIGRGNDNDICLDERTVHRYHAIIERSDEHGLVITDLSGPEGNGMRINGEKISRAGLIDGDLVELGAAKLRVVVPKVAWRGPAETTAAP